MSAFQNARNEFKKLKGEPLKVKLDYILSYYWIPIVAFIAIVAILISQIVHIATQKDCLLSGFCLNAIADHQATGQYVQQLSQAAGLDPETQKISFSTGAMLDSDPQSSYMTAQMLTARIAADDLDVLAGSSDELLSYAYQYVFFDLRTVLTDRQLEQLSAHFLYMDLSLPDDYMSVSDQQVEFPDPTKPEAMENPVPFAFAIPTDSAFHQLYYAHTDQPQFMGLITRDTPSPILQLFVDSLL